MKTGKWFLSTGFQPGRTGGWWHLLVAVHRRWQLRFVRPGGKPSYRRLYLGPFEIEWSKA